MKGMLACKILKGTILYLHTLARYIVLLSGSLLWLVIKIMFCCQKGFPEIPPLYALDGRELHGQKLAHIVVIRCLHIAMMDKKSENKYGQNSPIVGSILFIYYFVYFLVQPIRPWNQNSGLVVVVYSCDIQSATMRIVMWQRWEILLILEMKTWWLAMSTLYTYSSTRLAEIVNEYYNRTLTVFSKRVKTD